MNIETMFILGGIGFFIYAIVQKNNTERYIMYPISTGSLIILFVIFRYYGFIIAEIITFILYMIMAFGYPRYKRRNQKKNM